MKTIIAGGREYQPCAGAVHYLNSIKHTITEVVEGGATGADRFGRLWAEHNNIPVRTFNANWSGHGRAAGPIRNEQMAKYAAGGQCVLFPGGKGTANMFKNAKAYNLKIHDLRNRRDV